MTWITDHAGDVFNIVTAVIAVASLIAALTPSPKDDSVISGIRSVVNIFALNFKNAEPKDK